MDAKTKPQAPQIESDPDLVERIFSYLLDLCPEIGGDRLEEAKAAVRGEFAGVEVYVAAASRAERKALAGEVLRLFNGRNATEVARKLNISRASVYRHLKQPGGR